MRVRLGKYVSQTGPGIHVKIPYLDEFVIVNNRLRIAGMNSQTVTTLDRHAVTISASVGFRVEDPLAAMKRLHDALPAVSALLGTHISEYIQERDLADVRLPELRGYVYDRLSEMTSGLDIEFVAVVEFAVVKTYRLLNSVGHSASSGSWTDEPRAGILHY